jgi:hypothetical protein
MGKQKFLTCDISGFHGSEYERDYTMFYPRKLPSSQVSNTSQETNVSDMYRETEVSNIS